MFRLGLLTVVGLAVAVVLRLPALDMPLDRDLAAYATIGRFMSAHWLPYRDVFDHKQPLTYVVFWLLDLVAPQQVGAVRLAAALPSALAASLLAWILWPRTGAARAIAAGSLVLICSASLLVEGTDLNTEHLLVLTGALPVLAALVWQDSQLGLVPLGVGFLLGLAVLTKAVGIFAAPAALLPLLAVPRRSALHIVLLVGLGAAIPLAIVALVYVLAGALGDLWYANYTYNRLYVTTAARQWVPSGSGEVVRLSAAAVLVGLAALTARRGQSVLTLTLLAWLAGTAVGAQLSGRSFPHYYAPLIVPACALLCLPVARPRSTARPKWATAASALPAILALVVAVPFAKSVARTFGKTGTELAYTAYGAQAKPWTAAFAIGTEVHRRARPRDRMFVTDSEPEFYWASDVKPASYYIYDRPASVDRARYVARVKRDVCAHPPRWIVDPGASRTVRPPPCLPGLDYRPVLNQAGVVVYELYPSEG